MDDAPRAQVSDDIGEQRSEEQIMELEEVARPNVLGVVPEEGRPGLAARSLGRT